MVFSNVCDRDANKIEGFEMVLVVGITFSRRPGEMLGDGKFK